MPVVTSTQLVAMTCLALVATPLWAASKFNLGLCADDVGGAVMPPGMVMTRDTPAESMRDMSAVDPGLVTYEAPDDAAGAQIPNPRLVDGVKEFDLTASVISWPILGGQRMNANAINEQVPARTLRVPQGDTLRIHVTNQLLEPTTLHWHGLVVPNEMDGPAHITQEPIQPGDDFTYEFTAEQAGTFFYHSHDHPDRQQALGMYGALVVDPQASLEGPEYVVEYTVQLQEWLEREGLTYPAMLMEGGLPNLFTINGKAYPDTDTIQMEWGSGC